ncbi:MAG TPA: pre-peptidase, partial [Henriciella marina]|nr:pre-peptidase [Henriciella marina]
MKDTTRRNLLKVGAAGISGMAALSGRAAAQETDMTGISPGTIS